MADQWPRLLFQDCAGSFRSNQFREAQRSPQSANAPRDIFRNRPPELAVACARRSNGAWREQPQVAASQVSPQRGGSRSHAWFTATVHHAHFSSAALADRGTQLGVRCADAIDQLTAKATSLANWNDRVVRLLKWGVRHTLC
jgi:hypothetical protein